MPKPLPASTAAKRFTALLHLPSMNNPISALKNHARTNALRRKAADPANVAEHAQYLKERQLKGKTGLVYVKSGLFGKFLSSKPPLWNKQNSLNAYGQLLTATVANNLDRQGMTTRVGADAQALHNFRNAPQPLTAHEATAHTRALEKLVIQLATTKALAKQTPAYDALPLATPKQPAVSSAPAKTAERPPLPPKGLRQTQEMQLRKLGQTLRHPESQAALAHMGEGIRSDAEVQQLVERFHDDVEGLVAHLPQEDGISKAENLRRFVAESSLLGHVSELFGDALIHRYFDLLDSTPDSTESEPVTSHDVAEAPLPQAPSMQELDTFQRHLQQGKITRPAYPAVDRLVEQLNNSSGERISYRHTDPNEADDLLSFSMKGHSTVQGDLLGLTRRSLNSFGERTFETRLEAARFLFTETNFLESLNPSDSEYYKAFYLDLVQEAARFKVLEAQSQDDEKPRAS